MRRAYDEKYRFLSTPSARRATSISMSFAKAFLRFLSTPSARRATCRCGFPPVTYRAFLSTPSARRATLAIDHKVPKVMISIHALREEGDSCPRTRRSG